MANQRILYTEEMVGYGHPTKADTLNRLAYVSHNEDGTHKKLDVGSGDTDGDMYYRSSGLLTRIPPPAVVAGQTMRWNAAGTAPEWSSIPSKCSAYLSVNQSITKNAWSKIALDTENYDVNAEFDPSGNRRFTAKEAGYYSVKANLVFETLEAVAVISAIYLNGAAVAVTKKVANGVVYISLPVTKDVYLAVGHYIELYGYHNSSVDKESQGGNVSTFMTIHQLSRG